MTRLLKACMFFLLGLNGACGKFNLLSFNSGTPNYGKLVKVGHVRSNSYSERFGNLSMYPLVELRIFDSTGRNLLCSKSTGIRESILVKGELKIPDDCKLVPGQNYILRVAPPVAPFGASLVSMVAPDGTERFEGGPNPTNPQERPSLGIQIAIGPDGGLSLLVKNRQQRSLALVNFDNIEGVKAAGIPESRLEVDEFGDPVVIVNPPYPPVVTPRPAVETPTATPAPIYPLPIPERPPVIPSPPEMAYGATIENSQICPPGLHFPADEAGNPVPNEDGSITCCESPLIVDMRKGSDDLKDGIPLTAPARGVNFDLLGAKALWTELGKSKISWLKNSDFMWLVRPNAKGKVEGIDEMFGANTQFSDGTFSKNGYEALAKYVGTKGSVQQNDKVFRELRLWKDSNLDGIAQASELKTLSSFGVKEIDLVYDKSFLRIDEHGNRTTMKSKIVFSNGQFANMYDLWFKIPEQQVFKMRMSKVKEHK